jgi:hypothetical protein
MKVQPVFKWVKINLESDEVQGDNVMIGLEQYACQKRRNHL